MTPPVERKTDKTRPTGTPSVEDIRERIEKVIDIYDKDKEQRPNVEYGITPKKAAVVVLAGLFGTLLDGLIMEESGVPEFQVMPWGANFEEISNVVNYNKLVRKLNSKISTLQKELQIKKGRLYVSIS